MKLLLYPYTAENHFLLLSEGVHQITGVMLQQDWGIDRVFLNNRGIGIYNSLKEVGEEFDGIMFHQPHTVRDRKRKKILKEMENCLNADKHVFCVMCLDNQELEQIMNVTETAGKLFHYFCPLGIPSELEAEAGELQQCNVPIIYIGELCEGMLGQEFAVNLSIALKEKGYRVCTVIDDVCAELAGYIQTPGFMYEKIKESDKIFRFNQYIMQLNKEYDPELFIIQIPGSMFPLCKTKYSDFSIHCFYYSRAFCPDIFLGLAPVNLCGDEMVQLIHKNMKTCYGYGIDGILKRNLYLDMQDAFKYGYMNLMKLDRSLEGDTVLEYDKDDEIHIISEGSKGVYEKFCVLIEKLLSEEDIEVF